MNPGRSRAAILALAATAFALAGCSPAPSPDAPGSPDPTPTGTSVYQLVVGDCFDAQLGAALEYVDERDCADPHAYEIYASLLEADGDYPGADAIGQDARTRCAAAFGDFVGIRYEDSRLAVNYLAPTRADWTAGSRDVLCLLSDPAGTLTGSAQQTAQ